MAPFSQQFHKLAERDTFLEISSSEDDKTTGTLRLNLGDVVPQSNQNKREEISPELYQTLRKMARRYFQGERKAHTLAPTALVHEAFIRWEREASARSNANIPLVAVMARLMRESLINYAKSKHRLKRGGGAVQVTFEEEKLQAAEPQNELDLLCLDEALATLRDLDPKLAQLVEVRYFIGLTLEESAVALNTSPASVKRNWALAKAWLHNEIKKQKKAA